MALFVFLLLLCLKSFVWGEDHDHVLAVELGHGFHLRRTGVVFGDAVEDALPQFGMGNLSAPEHDGDLDLVSFGQELADLAGLGFEVSAADFGAVLHLLDGDGHRLAARFLVFLGELVPVLAVIEDLADGW